MIQHLAKFAKRTQREIRWWSYAAWSTPFVAIACLVLLNFLGWNNIYDKFIIIITSVFFGVSVFWWWWAIHKFATVFNIFTKTEKDLQEVKQHLIETRKIVQEEIKNVGDR